MNCYQKVFKDSFSIEFCEEMAIVTSHVIIAHMMNVNAQNNKKMYS